MKQFFKSIYVSNLLYYVIAAEVTFLVFGFFFPVLYAIAHSALIAVIALVIVDTLILFINKNGIFARRDTLDKLSNGDDNPVQILIENRYLFPIRIGVIDELPFQFQARDKEFKLSIELGKSKIIEYDVRPVKRGEYNFGAVNIYVKSPIGFIQKRYSFSQDMMVPVYPSFMQMRKYELF